MRDALLSVGVMAMIGALTGCSDKGAADTGGACSRAPALTYDNFGHGFLNQYCNGCHSSIVAESHREGAPAGVNFDTYEGVLTWAERIAARGVPDDASMPPGGGPGSEDRALLDEWITCTVLGEKARWEAK